MELDCLIGRRAGCTAGVHDQIYPERSGLTGFLRAHQPRGQDAAGRLGLVLGQEVAARADAHDLQARAVAAEGGAGALGS